MLSAFDIALYTADPRDEIYVGSSVGGVFSLKVSLYKHASSQILSENFYLPVLGSKNNPWLEVKRIQNLMP